jgi:DNA topoisomerase-1
VNAQQARRVLDRLVGYQISPLMWRKIKPGLSAGRVQSVAVRLICDRESAIRGFTPEEYWSFTGSFSVGGEEFKAELTRLDGRRLVRPIEEHRAEENTVQADNNVVQVASEPEARRLAQDILRQQYRIGEISAREHNRRALPPFTTSTLQQDAARKLGWTARRTMSVAQQLYEGVELHSGSEGLITYMRTDSVRVNPEALASVREVIAQRYGEQYLPDKPNLYKSKSNAQEAHEAIRPTDNRRDPESIKQYLSSDQYKLYRLIFNRFLASQIRAAEFETKSLEVSGGPYTFRTSVTIVRFDGHLAVYGEERAADEQDKELPAVNTGDPAVLNGVAPQQHFTKPAARFTDATLVRALEDNGIGRPSTYAPIIETILQRGYVVRVARHFEPTEWGFVTTEMMEHYFPDIVDVGFTRELESRLDLIEQGQADWRDAGGSWSLP